MSSGHSNVHSSSGRTEMSIGHSNVHSSIGPNQQKCPLDIQMSIRPVDEQKCPLDIQISIRPLDEWTLSNGKHSSLLSTWGQTTDIYLSGLLARCQNAWSQDGGNIRVIANGIDH